MDELADRAAAKILAAGALILYRNRRGVVFVEEDLRKLIEKVIMTEFKAWQARCPNLDTDILDSLMSLGFSKTEATQAVQDLKGSTVEEKLAEALQKLAEV